MRAVELQAETHTDERSSSGAAAAVEFVGVTKDFDGLRAVDDVSLAVHRGEFLALIGPSGCGKTTTLRLIGGMDRPTQGDVLIDGLLMNHVPPYRRDTATVWQQFALFPHYTVIQNVEFGLRMQKMDKETRRNRARAMLEKVGLEGYEERDIAELSGGQKQRVGLARALVTDPAVLLLDEPLGSLDANLRIAMQSELKALQRELGLTFIYVTHNQSEALAMADRIAVMNAGRIEQLDRPKEIYRNPRTRFVAEFVGSNNIFTGEVIGHKGEMLTVRSGWGEFRVKAANHSAAVPTAASSISCVVRSDAIGAVAADSVTAGDPESRENLTTGFLRGEEYLGASVVLSVELRDETMVKVTIPHADEEFDYRVGEPVGLRWQAGDVVILPESA